MHRHDNSDDLWGEFRKRSEQWRARQAAQREARRTKWAHIGDPSFWGLDEASLRSMGCMPPAGAASETEELKGRVASMEETIAKLHERIIVLEKLAVASDDTRLAAEIEKLRGADTRGRKE